MTIEASVHLKEQEGSATAPYSGSVQCISSLLAPILTMDGGSPTCVDRTKSTLAASYPGKVTEEIHEPEYHLIWNGDKWCLVCSSSGRFEVQVTETDTVVVKVLEGVHY